jgi:ring-1,2-phenylacetyl-CoA epoxidase subunit PaaC
MAVEVPAGIPRAPLVGLLVALGDDEFLLGHRDSEWTGHSPILEEDIAFSNIAQDEMGHALAWYTIHEELSGKSPDWMAFERNWKHFTCCHFVTYPKGDFAYTAVRQFFFDVAEQVRLKDLRKSSFKQVKEVAEKILMEEGYHLIHSRGLVERLGNATEESHNRMQAAVDLAFPQALGIFEELAGEGELIDAGVFSGGRKLEEEWLDNILPILASVSLSAPVEQKHQMRTILCKPETGGRKSWHNEHLKQLVADLQTVYKTVPGGSW